MPEAQSAQTQERERAASMAAAQAGDRAAYARVLAASVPLIKAVARRRGVVVDRLDDVVQETLLSVHQALPTYDPARSYDAWLGAIASRRAVDAMRKYGRDARREVSDEFALDSAADVDDASADSERRERAARLREAVAGLPPAQREAVEQIGLRERDLAEAAARTGRGRGALKVNFHRALKSLRGRIHGDD